MKTDYNKDSKDDIVFVQNNYLHVFLQDNEGNYSNDNSVRVDLNFELTQAYSLMVNNNNPQQRNRFKDKIGLTCLRDMNADGLLDIMTEKFSVKDGTFNPKKQFNVFFGKEHSSDPSKGGIFNKVPDHIIINRGFQVHSRISDLNNDGKLDIIIPVIEMSLFKFISMLITGNIDVTILAYIMDDTGKYRQEPDDELVFEVEIDKNGRKVPVSDINGDYNGDGRKDLLRAQEGNLLIYYAGDGKLKEDADVEFPFEVPDDGKNVKSQTFNAAAKSGVVVVYSQDEETIRKNNVRILITK